MRLQLCGLAAVVALSGCLTKDQRSPDTIPDFLYAAAPKAELLFLGVFHFDDKGLDAYKPKFRLDITSPERQRQIDQLVDQLAGFRPTTVAVEALPTEQRRLDSLFALYSSDRYELETNEVFQLGFRLAKRAGLQRVIGADAESRSYMTEAEAMAKVKALGLNMDSIMRAIQNDPWSARYQRLYAYDDSIKTVRSLAQHLLYINSAERVRVGHGAYVVGSFKLGPNADYLGVDDATQWYNRNLRIFSNLQHMTSGPSERIILIIGAGHLPILRFLAQSAPEYRLREPAEFIVAR
ncbi:MAG TPA: DUF5694 domain-containing protein [Gemmatimonadaceae bacterium]|nr:DUF5694 domain-containing protein [Gemmatimonadaceae bacterium]